MPRSVKAGVYPPPMSQTHIMPSSGASGPRSSQSSSSSQPSILAARRIVKTCEGAAMAQAAARRLARFHSHGSNSWSRL
jgi:hypothetical protein